MNWLLITVFLLADPIFGAQEPTEDANPEPARLDVLEAIEFVGTWQLRIEPADRPRDLELTISESEDGLSVTLLFEGNERPIRAHSLSRSGDDLVIGFRRDLHFGNSQAELKVRLDAGRPVGVLQHPNGLFRIAARSVEPPSGDTPLGNGDVAADVRRVVSELDGIEFEVRAPVLDADGADYRKITDLDRNETLRWLGPAIVLESPAALMLGDLELAPGAYTLWLRRVDAGWALVVNAGAAAWATQHVERNEVGVTNLEYSQGPGAAPLETSLDEDSLSLSWGTHRWSARVSVP